ncbi:hypothetical protein [Bacillus sp. FJAT-45037]|uniref:hypothetical protein n=1 Tax=Bacillus sp. FJAT-45037 TaxID=2011007 RepID=UPI000C230C13|nr:hypothetical protein [Bacillus sp. FJAT-45037]
MNWFQQTYQYIGQPVGVSLVNGQGTTGVLCEIDQEKVYLLEYLYASQFALKQYPLNQIQNITPFPPCQPNRFSHLYF